MYQSCRSLLNNRRKIKVTTPSQKTSTKTSTKKILTNQMVMKLNYSHLLSLSLDQFLTWTRQECAPRMNKMKTPLFQKMYKILLSDCLYPRKRRSIRSKWSPKRPLSPANRVFWSRLRADSRIYSLLIDLIQKSILISSVFWVSEMKGWRVGTEKRLMGVHLRTNA